MTASPIPLQLPSVFTRAETIRQGVSNRRLYAWRDEGLVEMLGRGLFMKVGTEGDPDLIEVAVRAPSGTLCLASALVRHQLTDQIPGTIHVAIERSRRSPRTMAPVTWHRFDEATFAIDREEFAVTDGYTLGVYGPMRTIIDAFRLRHIHGQEMAIDALRRWLNGRGNQPSTLLEMVRCFPMTAKPIRAALEILL